MFSFSVKDLPNDQALVVVDYENHVESISQLLTGDYSGYKILSVSEGIDNVVYLIEKNSESAKADAAEYCRFVEGIVEIINAHQSFSVGRYMRGYHYNVKVENGVLRFSFLGAETSIEI